MVCAIPYKEEIFSTAKSLEFANDAAPNHSFSKSLLFQSENPTTVHFSTAKSDPFIINFQWKGDFPKEESIIQIPFPLQCKETSVYVIKTKPKFVWIFKINSAKTTLWFNPSYSITIELDVNFNKVTFYQKKSFA